MFFSSQHFQLQKIEGKSWYLVEAVFKGMIDDIIKPHTIS